MEDAREIISKFDKINQRTGSLTNITIKNPEYKNVYEDFEVGAIDKPGVQTIIEAARREFEKIAKGPKPQIQKEGDLQRGFIKDGFQFQGNVEEVQLIKINLELKQKEARSVVMQKETKSCQKRTKSQAPRTTIPCYLK